MIGLFVILLGFLISHNAMGEFLPIFPKGKITAFDESDEYYQAIVDYVNSDAFYEDYIGNKMTLFMVWPPRHVADQNSQRAFLGDKYARACRHEMSMV